MAEDPLRNQLILLPLTDKFCYYLGIPINSWAYYYDVQEFMESKIDHWRIKKYFDQVVRVPVFQPDFVGLVNGYDVPDWFITDRAAYEENPRYYENLFWESYGPEAKIHELFKVSTVVLNEDNIDRFRYQVRPIKNNPFPHYEVKLYLKDDYDYEYDTEDLLCVKQLDELGYILEHADDTLY